MMLEAFDRFLAIQDRATYFNAMERLQRQLNDHAPTRAVFVPIADEESRKESDLAESPDLTEVRERLAVLITQLRIQGIEPPPMARA